MKTPAGVTNNNAVLTGTVLMLNWLLSTNGYLNFYANFPHQF